MKLLKCLLCRGECEIVGGEHSVNRKIKCSKCGYTNIKDPQQVMPEVIVVRKKPNNPD